MDADLAAIRALSVDEVERWLALVENGDVVGPTDVNQWLNLLITWTDHVRQPGNEDDRLRWARVAARVYTKLDRENASRMSSFLADQLRLRSYVIEQFGSVPGDPFFDVASVIEALRRRLPLPYEEAVERLRRLRATDPRQWGGPISDLRELRWAKNLLRATARLYERGYFPDAPDIERWSALREALP